MIKNIILENYANSIRKKFAEVLLPGVGLNAIIHPVRKGGAIFEFVFNKNSENSNFVQPISNNIRDALNKSKQTFLNNTKFDLVFLGTVIGAENDRVIIIKGHDNQDIWEESAVKSDFLRIKNLEQKKTG